MTLGSVASAFLFGKPLLALLGVLGPLTYLGVTLAQNRGEGKERRERQGRYDEAVATLRQRVQTETVAEAARARDATPDLAALVEAATGPTALLWSRDPTEGQALAARVGLHDRPVSFVVPAPEGQEPLRPQLLDVPYAVDLRTCLVLGITGSQPHARALARSVVLQVACLRSPADLAVVHVGADTSEEWEWLRWLPHTATLLDGVRSVGPNPDAVKARLAELRQLVEQREDLGQSGYGETLLLPEVLVVLDGAAALRKRSGVVELLARGPRVGVYFVAVDGGGQLPAESGVRLLLDEDGVTLTAELRGGETVADVLVDLPDVATAMRAARAVAPLRPLGGADTAASLPDQLRFSDLYGGALPDAASVQRLWSEGEEGRSTIGVDEHGAEAVIDLRRHGPHGLVAGTTGSGKSEFLRTLLIGWSLSASPQDLQMLLIDFKGNGAFGKLADLPHVVGLADDLALQGVNGSRMIAALKAELDHRKRRFAEGGHAEDLGAYRRARRTRTDLAPISRLLIVVDEFAELMQQQPDFIDGLQSISRVGRSLGVHLLLATQRPAGVVTPQIRDNADLRVCLRVRESGTSTDLVDSPVAASFSSRTKGRFAVGGESGPTVGQSAYVSGPVVTRSKAVVTAASVSAAPWSQCGLANAEPPRAEDESAGPTELSEVVASIGAAARALRLPAPRRPWLPPLPDVVSLEDLEVDSRADGTRAGLPWALVDEPERQRQVPLRLELGGGHLAIVGSARSGRSTALRTLAAAAAQRSGSELLQVHAIDWSAVPALGALEALPQVGVVATKSQRPRVSRLIELLHNELERRGELLAARGLGSWQELTASPQRGAHNPFLLVLVDGADQLLADLDGTPAKDRLVTVLREGSAVGIQVVTTGGTALVRGPLATLLGTTISLRFDDRDDFAAVGLQERHLPGEVGDGRGFSVPLATPLQVAVVGGQPATEHQLAALRALGAALPPPPADRRPWHVDELPREVMASAAAALPLRPADGDLVVALAVGGDRLVRIGVDVTDGAGPFVVAGPPGSGRSTVLRLLTEGLVAAGHPVLLVRGSSTSLAMPGVPTVQPGEALPTDRELLGATVLVDDAHAFAAMDSALMELLASAESAVVAGDTETLMAGYGWATLVQRAQRGLVLSPGAGRYGDLLGVSLGPPKMPTTPPGRGWLGGRGHVELVQVLRPEADGAPTASGRSRRRIKA